MDKGAAKTLNLPHVAARVFGTPLAIARAKLDAILAVLGPRIGVALPGVAASPEPTADLVAFEPRKRARVKTTRDGIAVVQIIGPLVARAGWLDAECGISSYGSIAAEIDEALASDDVRGILLDIDSPGGEVSGCFDLVDKIRAAGEQKPIFAVANEQAFSAAYAIASAAKKIFVPRTAGVGSIGVVALHVDQSKFDAEVGLTFTYVHAGAKKVDGNPHAPLSPRALTDLQAEVGRFYDLFVATVASHRSMAEHVVRATEAGLFFGEKAVEAGLADQVGTFDDALEALRAEVFKNNRASGSSSRGATGGPMSKNAKAALEKGAAENTVAAEGSAETERDVLLAENAKLKAENAELAQKASSLEGRVGSLEASIKALNAVEEARKKAEASAYLDDLRRRCAAAGHPLAEQDDPKDPTAPSLAKVAAAFARGDEQTAKVLGESFFRLSQARGRGGLFDEHATKTTRLAPSSAHDDEAFEAELDERVAAITGKPAK